MNNYNLNTAFYHNIFTIAGIDYQPLIRNVTFSQLVASVAIQINIIENNITDGNRIFGLRLVIPEESKQLGIELGTPSESTITIIDDDGNIFQY